MLCNFTTLCKKILAYDNMEWISYLLFCRIDFCLFQKRLNPYWSLIIFYLLVPHILSSISSPRLLGSPLINIISIQTDPLNLLAFNVSDTAPPLVLHTQYAMHVRPRWAGCNFLTRNESCPLRDCKFCHYCSPPTKLGVVDETLGLGVFIWPFILQFTLLSPSIIIA